jgi:uncharacterized protein YndB with AHSA1/START domain
MEKAATREMQVTRTFKAPIDLVWEAWTNPAHIVSWWGPVGFTCTVHTIDFREGGEWKLTLHGPDGTNYPNRSIYREIIPLKKIVFEHYNPHFITTVVFESNGGETRIQWILLFDTPEMRETVVKVHKAEEGQKQNLEKLEKHLSERL